MSKRIFLIALSAAILAVAWYWPSDNLQVIMCDVGQGDAILFSRRFSQVLVDGGPGRKVLSCLQRHMPRGDKTIETVILTHPESDHGQGLLYVAERYTMKYFVSGGVGSNSQFYQALLDTLSSQDVTLINTYRGDELTVAGVNFAFLWPDKDWLRQELSDKKTEVLFSTPLNDNKMYKRTTKILGAVDERLSFNDYSLVFRVAYDDFDVLMMGDADAQVQSEIERKNTITNPDILKVAHHGAKEAFQSDFLRRAVGRVALISVGENSWGHPDEELVNRLKKVGMKVWRTDRAGDIKLVTNGRVWWRKR